jgi:uncharacterized protein YdeI (YjbR/CyaY-like superfamily)
LPGVKPRFFATPAKFRAWLEKNHARSAGLLVGFHKKGSGKTSIDWPQSVDEALCFGWIDGVRRSLGRVSYTIRFTPRKARSTWSAINIRRVKVLTREGRMSAAGLAAYGRRSSERSAIYAYEQRKTATLEPGELRHFKKQVKAWTFFSGQAASYRHVCLYWINLARKSETRKSRLARLVAASAVAKRLK